MELNCDVDNDEKGTEIEDKRYSILTSYYLYRISRNIDKHYI